MAAGGALLVMATVVGVGYFEWWGGDSDGVYRAFYPLVFSSGVVFLVASRMRPRAPHPLTTKGTSLALPNAESDDNVPFARAR